MNESEYNVCDCHMHIIPHIDDGSPTFDTSMEMLRKAYIQGVRKIMCTSHSYGMYDETDVTIYQENYRLLKSKLNKAGIDIQLYTGCEIQCDVDNIDDVINRLNHNQLPTLNHTEYVLIEFYPTDVSFITIQSCLTKLQANGYKVILAHTERYPKLFLNDAFIYSLMKQGCLFQVNAYSLELERNYDVKMRARRLLEDRYISFIGSDAHNMSRRSPKITDGVKYIYSVCDKAYADNICFNNAKQMLKLY